MSKKTNSYKHQEDLNIMDLQKCCVCKMSKDATGHDDSRTMCLLYENLLDRTHRRKIKTRIRWRGNLDSLKDFLTLLLRKKWHLDGTYQTYNEPYVQNRRSDNNLLS